MLSLHDLLGRVAADTADFHRDALQLHRSATVAGRALAQHVLTSSDRDRLSYAPSAVLDLVVFHDLVARTGGAHLSVRSVIFLGTGAVVKLDSGVRGAAGFQYHFAFALVSLGFTRAKSTAHRSLLVTHTRAWAVYSLHTWAFLEANP